jgi:3'-phosphoadenosine 5'-phosphosulfate sulfotransferase (PAPS reductase)/FAD synthetase
MPHPGERAGEREGAAVSPELRAKLAGRRVVASISGGKDSAAMSLWLTEQGIEHHRVFMDTGWEHPATYEYLRGPLAAKIGPIQWLRSERGGMVEWVRHKGTFPSKQRRWCTEELKVKPLARWLAEYDAGAVNAVGIRAAESEARARLSEWEWSDAIDCETWRPLLTWTEADVIAIHHRHGLAPNPLYLRGAERVGCWPCIYARKAELRLLGEIDPERVGQINALEIELSAAAAAPRGWFQAPLGRVGVWSIGEVIAWSRTSRGGRQFELFDAPEHERGCVRWGLCETGTDPEASHG